MRSASLLLTCLFCCAIAPAAGDSEPVQGRFWYFCDHLESRGDDGGEITLLVTLPFSHAGQNLNVGEIHPSPEAVIEGADQGNRLILWKQRDLGGTEMTSFYYDFTVTLEFYEPEVDLQQVEAYDKTSDLYRRYTQPEHWIELTPAIQAKAAEIAGTETRPYQQAEQIYDWIVANMTFDYTEVPDKGAAKSFARRSGDCGEFSAVFCALCRSLGIPARPVSGLWLGGGLHKWAEFYLPPYGWIPADPAGGQLLRPDSQALSETEIEEFTARRGITDRDPKVMFGRRHPDRICVSHGYNIEVHMDGADVWRTFRFLQPGGADAYPPAVEFHDLQPSVVHGGFFLFGEKSRDPEYALEVAYQRLAQDYFDLGMFERVEKGCNQLLESDPDDAGAWLNLGRVYLGKEEHYKAIASFSKALLGQNRNVRPVTEVWARNLLGNCYDLVGRREMAVREYRKVVELAFNYHGAVDYANKYLNTPYQRH